MQSPKTPARTAEDERRDILDYIRHLHDVWSMASPSIRPGLDSAIIGIIDEIGKGRHVTSATAQPANPDSYRSIALANGAKECNVYHHDDKVVVVVEMGLGRSVDEVQAAIQIVTPLISERNVVVREVRPYHDGVAVLPDSTPPTKEDWYRKWHESGVDPLADLERRIADLESRVRNNTRRLDLAAAACRDIAGRYVMGSAANEIGERLGTGLKEQA